MFLSCIVEYVALTLIDVFTVGISLRSDRPLMGPLARKATLVLSNGHNFNVDVGLLRHFLRLRNIYDHGSKARIGSQGGGRTLRLQHRA
ncbi:hypothetical protein VNO78_11425 [Psophocarpus tetragonolobus]|uniref:Uncharacterized protein n=1 Tax=Psophocarpus tetragonolobus TaxID=3891 RepID=A0AAN9XNN8_PSOTE